VSNMSLEEMLAACESTGQAQWDTAYDDWLPPKGKYTVTFTDVRFNTFTKNGEVYGMLALRHEILDGVHAGKAFEWVFYANNSFSVSTLKKLVKLVTGMDTPSFADGVRKLVSGVKGKTAEVEIGSRNSKTTGESYDTIKYLRMVSA